jgi:hypothetical protein
MDLLSAGGDRASAVVRAQGGDEGSAADVAIEVVRRTPL